MEQEQIEKIRDTRLSLAELVVAINPQNQTEWEAFDLLAAAFRDMRRIKLDKLGQLPLPDDFGAAPEPKEQLPLPEGAAVHPGEDSLNTPAPPALVQTSDDEFNTLGHERAAVIVDNASPIKRGRRHASA